MKIISIHATTTGSYQNKNKETVRGQVLSVAAVYESTMGMGDPLLPVKELPCIHLYAYSKSITGNPLIMGHHADILQEIGRYVTYGERAVMKEGLKFIPLDDMTHILSEWIRKLDNAAIKRHYNLLVSEGGKSFLPSLQSLKHWDTYIGNRVVATFDPMHYVVNWGNDNGPDLETCLLKTDVWFNTEQTGDALARARLNIQLLRKATNNYSSFNF